MLKPGLFPSAVSFAMLTLAASCASAQGLAPSASIYGILDVALERITGSGGGVTRVPNLTGTSPSRLGFRGSEDLGGGLQAIFNLEMGVAVDTGAANNGGRLFGRAAYVGLAGGFGRVTLGRQPTMTVQAINSVMGPNLYALASLDNYLPNAITDNTVGYLGSFSGVTVGATYSLGRDTASVGGPSATNCPGETGGDANRCKQWSALVKYDTADFGAALSHDLMHGGPGALFGLVSSSYTDERTIASGWFKAGPVKVSGGVLHRKRQLAVATRSNLMYVGASYPLTPVLTLDGELSKLDVKSSPDDASMATLRLMYALSKRTSVYVMGGKIWNKGASAVSVTAAGPATAAGQSQTAMAVGIRHVF